MMPIDRLPMPDGRRVGALRLLELAAEMQRLKIPGVTAGMNKETVLRCYEAHVSGIARTFMDRHAQEHNRPPSEAHIRRAVEQIAAQA